MLYQSLKLTNGIWVLAELRIQPSNPSFTVRPFPCLPPKQPRGGSEPKLLPALPSPLTARSLGWAGWPCGTSAVVGFHPPRLLLVPAPSPAPVPASLWHGKGETRSVLAAWALQQHSLSAGLPS